MNILAFRPFKKLSDDELIHRIDEVFKSLRLSKSNYKENQKLCDELIKEVKCRNLCCSKEILYKKILFK